MKRALIFVLAALLLTAASGEASGQKNKNKEKRFEPATRADVKDYGGRYVGIESSYFIEIAVSRDGKMHIKSYEGERVATLRAIRLEGSALTATKVYADSATESFHARFVNRIRNGQSTFGLIVDDMQVSFDGLMLTNIFYAFDKDKVSGAHAFAESSADRARQEIEARYRELAEAVSNKDFAAFQALRTENFSARLPDGDVHDSAQMSRRAATLFGQIQAPMKLSNQIELLIVMDHEAIALVHQKFSRMQEIAGRLHLVETSSRQRETWIKTEDGWKLKFVDNIRAQRTVIDGEESVEEG